MCFTAAVFGHENYLFRFLFSDADFFCDFLKTTWSIVIDGIVNCAVTRDDNGQERSRSTVIRLAFVLAIYSVERNFQLCRCFTYLVLCIDCSLLIQIHLLRFRMYVYLQNYIHSFVCWIDQTGDLKSKKRDTLDLTCSTVLLLETPSQL